MNVVFRWFGHLVTFGTGHLSQVNGSENKPVVIDLTDNLAAGEENIVRVTDGNDELLVNARSCQWTWTLSRSGAHPRHASPATPRTA